MAKHCLELNQIKQSVSLQRHSPSKAQLLGLDIFRSNNIYAIIKTGSLDNAIGLAIMGYLTIIPCSTNMVSVRVIFF